MPFIITSKFITKLLSIFISVYAVTLYPFIIASEQLDEFTMNHELIHFEQQKELFVIGFYFLYTYDFIKGIIKHKDKEVAYFMIRFEQEAYEHQNNLGYTFERNKHSWKKYEV